MSAEEKVTIYTDGACSGNPGPGGWGFILISEKHARFLSAFSTHTTNNKMEMTAAIEALNAVKPTNKKIELFTDSNYVVKGITEWLPGWRAKQWVTAKKEPVLNKDLWEILEQKNKLRRAHWHWVKGHHTNRYNNFCDWLARNAISRRMGQGLLAPIDEVENFIDRALSKNPNL